jgi:8-oxo-dGTP pyrophosphatase MutT (NUDIX family)
LTDVPEFLIRHAEEFAASGARAVPPRPAATVVLLRQAAGPEPGRLPADSAPLRPLAAGFEVYLVRRAATMRFAPGMYAFPGGAVDPRDASSDVRWVGPSAAQWAYRLGLPESQARAVVCAAVREVFEESGVLLAGIDESTVVGDVSTVEWEVARAAVQSREVGFADTLSARDLLLRGDLLAPWSRWITPEFEPRRYDTFFFVARLPEGQVTRDVGGEADERVWCSPAQVGDLPKLPPTAVTLAQLAEYAGVDEVMAAATTGGALAAIRPRIEDGRFRY